MVDDREGTTFGYMGLDFIDWGSRSGEVDAIVRGGAAPKGAMAASLTTLIAWARAQLGLKEIGVRVRSDNPALRFYEKIGFSEYRRTNLVKRSVPRETHWIENSVTETGSLSLVYFRYQR